MPSPAIARRGLALLVLFLAAAAAAEAPSADGKPGEAEKAEAVSKLEADIEAATQQKTTAAKADDREEVKRLVAELKHLRVQLGKAKAKPPEKYVEEAEERARIEAEKAKLVADKKRKEEEQKRLDRLLMRDGKEPGERNAAAGFPIPAGVNPIEVVFAAQEAVKAKLKNPAGAKFPSVWRGVDIRSHCKFNGDGTYTVQSWVDATNSFGGQLRVPYVATVKKRGNGWEVTDAVLIE